MYDFIKIQWILHKYNAETLAKCVVKGLISQAQADEIMVMAQMN